MKVIGIKPVSYNRKSDGNHIEGVEIHYTYTSKNIEGVGCDRAFISSGALDRMGGEVPAIGAEIEFVYNRFGKVAGFTVI